MCRGDPFSASILVAMQRAFRFSLSWLLPGVVAALCVALAAVDSAEAFILRTSGMGYGWQQGTDAARYRSTRRTLRRTVSSMAGGGVSQRSSARGSITPQSSSARAVRDTRTDTSVRANFLLLDEVSPAIAGVRFFSTAEPVRADRIVIQLTADVPTVEAILVYDEAQRYLGLATQEAGTAGRYILRFRDGVLTLPHKREHSLYVRARLKSRDYGGESGQAVQVSSVDIEGSGGWSDSSYVQSSTETFPAFETARGVPTVIRNAGLANAALAGGTNQLIGQLRFEGREMDSEAHVRLMALRFTINAGGEVAVSNVQLRVEGSDVAHPCTVVTSIATCSSIPVSHGSLESPRILRVYGDVTVPQNATSAFLFLSLNDPGSISSSGSVTWTDGSTIFTWVPFEQPIANGTMFR